MVVPGKNDEITASVNSILKGKTRSVFKHLHEFNGSTQYRAVKCISRERKMATSTIKYALRKLEEAGVINYDGRIELTMLGTALINFIGGNVK